MPNKRDITLMAHLMQRAGFGATRHELESFVGQGYEETVEQLLHPEEQPKVDEYTLYRYHPNIEIPSPFTLPGQANWLYHMVNTKRPLEEKVALFWHQVFATGNAKVDNVSTSLISSRCSASAAWATSGSCWWSWPKTRP